MLLTSWKEQQQKRILFFNSQEWEVFSFWLFWFVIAHGSAQCQLSSVQFRAGLWSLKPKVWRSPFLPWWLSCREAAERRLEVQFWCSSPSPVLSKADKKRFRSSWNFGAEYWLLSGVWRGRDVEARPSISNAASPICINLISRTAESGFLAGVFFDGIRLDWIVFHWRCLCTFFLMATFL